MPGDKYEMYGKPTPPADINQEFMTVQETAYVLGCSVPTVRRRIKELGLRPNVGRRIKTSKRDRLDIHESSQAVPRRRGRLAAAA